MVKIQPNAEISNDPGKKYIILVTLDPVDSYAMFANGVSISRRPLFFTCLIMCSKAVERIVSAFPDHLIIYSSDSSHFVRRQLGETPDSGPLFSAPNHTAADGGILKRYQLLTPGLILTLIVVFFVLVPVIALGVNALASIQSPLRAEAPRSFNAKDKKNQ